MEIVSFLQSFANPQLDKVFTFITMLGEDNFFMLLFILFFWCIDKRFGYRLGFACLSNGVLNTWIKEFFHLPRPYQEHPELRALRVETATGYSFPSGHTQTTASMWTSFALRYKRTWLTIAAAVIILLVGTSRMYLGMHYPRDVVFGAVLGVGWVFVSNWLFSMVEKGKKFILLVFLIPALALPFVYLTPDSAKIAGTVAGCTAGYFIETGYIKFKTEATLIQHFIKLFVGIGMLLALRIGIKALLPQWLICDFFRYLLIGFWVIAGAPYLFKRFLKESLEG